MQHLRSDADWLAAAARLAQRARPLSRPNPGVGAIIVKDNIVVGRGWTMAGGRPHAEAVALEQAGSNAAGATLYCTLEPCAHVSVRGPCCADLIVAAQVKTLVYAVEDPDPRTCGTGAVRIAAAGIETRRVASAPADASLAGYQMVKRNSRPHVTLKLALSLDGCIALADGQSRWITGDVARAHVHAQRAQADAILVGGNTWRSDKPHLGVRLAGLESRSPNRIVLTRSGNCGDVETVSAPQQIAQLAGVQYLYLEGGAQTAAAFLKADLVDLIHLYRAPILIGGGKPALTDIGLTDLRQAHGRWKLADRRELGSDLFEAYERTPCSPE